jgi:5-deoxy-glucuronate isomerase
MADLLLKNHAPDRSGLVHRVTPESAGWGHVGFELYRLEPGQGLEASTSERELCLVLVGGKAKVRGFGEIGDRMGPFENKKPYAVYLPKGTSYQLEATTPLELAVCSAPGGGSYEPRLIGPDQIAYSKRGKDTNTRHVYDILPEGEPAQSLLVVEVITPSGCWSPRTSTTRSTCPKNPSCRRPTITASTRPRALPCSGSTPTTARSTSRWRSRTATW